MAEHLHNPSHTNQIEREVRDWLDRFARAVRAVDYDAGRALCDPSIRGFGTRQRTMTGLDTLIREQWSRIWPVTDGFTFLTDHLSLITDATGELVCVMTPWTSTGYDADNEPFERPGRATIVLRRIESGSENKAGDDSGGGGETSGGAWLAVHTHLSLDRGVSQTTQRQPPKPAAGRDDPK